MSERARVAVVGVGHLGSRHARVYSRVEAAELVAVVDIDAARARAVGEQYGAEPLTDFRALVGRVDAVSVAVPTVHHREVALELIEQGVHVLVEKPMTSTLEEARELIARAASNDVVLAVGHTERFNPAVEAVLEQAVDPRFIEVHRLASFSPRSLDIDVILDLMIHDLDVVLALVAKPVASLEAVGVPILTPKVDIANARIRFEGGAVANITASRVSQDKVRKLRVFEGDRYVSLDYQKQEAVRFRLVPSSGARPDIRRDVLAAETREPLAREIEDFLGAAASGATPRVGGDDGLRALELALSVVEAIDAG